jgi:Uma2 family endonuclease
MLSWRCWWPVWNGSNRTDFFIGANLTIYFSRDQLKQRDFRGSDFFLVTHTERKPRRSWVVWEEGGRYPDLIIELLSPATSQIDCSLKKALYQDRFRTPEYFWFSPDTLEFEGYRLVGQHYEAIVPNQAGWRWSEVLGLFLGVQDGQLRYLTQSGALVPTPTEVAAQAEARSQRLAEQLRALGVEPDG